MRADMYSVAVPSWFTAEEAALVAGARVMMRGWSGLRKLEHYCEFNDGDGEPGSENLQLAYGHVLSAYRTGGADYSSALGALLKIQLIGAFNTLCLVPRERRYKQKWELDLIGRNIIDPSAASGWIKDAAFLLRANHAIYAVNGEPNLGELMAEFLDEYHQQILDRQQALDKGLTTWEEVAAIYTGLDY